MLGIKTRIKFAKLFFDREAVIKALDRATYNIFMKFGAFVMTTAKQSIKKRFGPAAPGQPPHSHAGLLKKFIYFGYDKWLRSVVIGPYKLPRKHEGPNTVPQVLEHGGVTLMTGYPLNRRQRKKYPHGKKVHIKERPYMNPAMKKNLNVLPPMWRDSIKPA